MSERSLFCRDHPVFCALVNGEGEVTDFLRLPHFTKRRNAWREEEREKKVNLGAAIVEMNVCTLLLVPCNPLRAGEE